MEWELEVTVGTMDECGEKEADSQWRTSVTTRIKKNKKDWTGPGSVGS